jgi:hypothetical protein
MDRRYFRGRSVSLATFPPRHRESSINIPLRVFVYTDAAGKTFIAYDQPSSLLGSFRCP